MLEGKEGDWLLVIQRNGDAGGFAKDTALLLPNGLCKDLSHVSNGPRLQAFTVQTSPG